MISTLLITILLNPFRPCEGSPTARSCGCDGPPTFQEEYRGRYLPKVIETWRGLQVVAPDTPYVAAASANELYFIDTRLDNETASRIKQNIESAASPRPEEYVFIDEIMATAERRNRATGETTFVFDPTYAKVLFGRAMKRRNPKLELPEYTPPGAGLVAYDLDALVASN